MDTVMRLVHRFGCVCAKLYRILEGIFRSVQNGSVPLYSVCIQYARALLCYHVTSMRLQLKAAGAAGHKS